MGLADATGDEGGEDHGGDGAGSHPAARREPAGSGGFAEKEIPPVRAALREAGRNLLPNTLTVIRRRLRHWKSVDGSQQGVYAREFFTALRAIAEVCGKQFPADGFAIVIGDPFFLFRMFHSWVPMARVCPRRSTKGCRALRNFWTERKTVFLAALVLDFRASAISSMPEPPQWRITNAVRSAGESSLSARRISTASWPLWARRSGEGAVSGTALIGSGSWPSSLARAGRARFASSLLRWRMRSMA